jgi:GTP cyclohydrolase IA
MNDKSPQVNGPPPVAGLVGEALVPVTDEEEWAAVSPRQITPEQWQRFEDYLKEIFGALGLPFGSAATADTPRRFLRALFDATSGYEGDEKLITAFETECRGGSNCRISQVIEGPINVLLAL